MHPGSPAVDLGFVIPFAALGLGLGQRSAVEAAGGTLQPTMPFSCDGSGAGCKLGGKAVRLFGDGRVAAAGLNRVGGVVLMVCIINSKGVCWG